MALPRANRLSLRFERDHLTNTGKTVHGKFFSLVGAKTTSPVPRFAILLSKKIASHAVDRNRIKRITSGILESLLPSLPLKDFLIIPKHQVLTENNKNLLEDLKSLLLKIGN